MRHDIALGTVFAYLYRDGFNHALNIPHLFSGLEVSFDLGVMNLGQQALDGIHPSNEHYRRYEARNQEKPAENMHGKQHTIAL